MTSDFYVLRQIFNAAQMYPQKVALVLDDQAWTYSELIEQVERVTSYLHHSNIVQGQIIYQFVERSLEMICGLLGIVCAGGVYCALNPTDPLERLVLLLKQMQGQYVLLHKKTRQQFPSSIVQHMILLDDILLPSMDVESQDNGPLINEYGAAYIKDKIDKLLIFNYTYKNMTSDFYVLRQIFNAAQMYPQKVALVLDDQAWTYSELIEQVARVTSYLHHSNIVQGQIIYQFVERSFEMICGLLGIVCAGGVYCALNPTDPLERLVLLLEQIQGQYVLLHEKTRELFPSSIVSHIISLDDILLPSIHVEILDNHPLVNQYGAAYIICTSGSTGRQKAVVHTHRSHSTSITTFSQWDGHICTTRDQMLQVAGCSWVAHLTEILLPLIAGGTLVLLRPNGHLDMDYFSKVLTLQQVTTLMIGPSIIRALLDYIEITHRLEMFKFLHKLCTTGEPMKPKQLTELFDILKMFNVQVSTIYGMSECLATVAYQLLNFNEKALPIGYLLPGYRCLLIDEKNQLISYEHNSSDIGQIHIAGSNIFNGYLDDPKRTADMFVTINNNIYLKTGDLARYNARGELVYVGRTDFQIKIRGQRVETTEIEDTIVNSSPNKIFNCLVTKVPQTDDLLVAYVISNDLELNIEEIRDYCNKRLRQYMVPFYFIVLDKFPLNAAGKIDRKQLPLPSLSTNVSTNSDPIDNRPLSELEERVHNIWCSILRLNTVPLHMSCFALGGSSLSLMQIFNHYRVYLTPDKQLDILDFFMNPTINDHVQLLIKSETKSDIVWNPLNLVLGRASYAQESIWLAEQTRFIPQTPSVSPYNTSSIYRIDSGHLSIKQCLEAIDLIVTRHMVFRTRLVFNVECGYLQQSFIPITPNSQRPYQVCCSTVQSEQEFKALEFENTMMPIADGVFRCHFIRYGHTSEDVLKQNDYVIFTFHHGSIDAASIDLFLNELTLGYSGNYDLEKPLLQYIDYSEYERSNKDMSAAKDYWKEILRSYPWDRQLDLPYDFGVPLNARRSGRCWFVVTPMPSEIIEAIKSKAKQLNVSLLQLTLTCFYIFLAQLSPHNQDACVTIPIRNRYRPELENIIGLFANMLPCRMTFDASSTSTMTFIDLLHKVQNNLASMIKYGNMSYSEILELHRVPTHDLQLPFLHTYFALIELSDDSYFDRTQLNLSRPAADQESCMLSSCYPLYDPEDYVFFAFPNMFDFDISIFMNKENVDMACTYSTDLFTYTTIDMLLKKYLHLLSDLFIETPVQQLKTTPLVKLVSMAKEPINIWRNNHHEEVDSITKILTPLEEHIQGVFCGILNVEQIDVNKSFFEQGGTSLKALQAIYSLQDNPMTNMVDANLFFANLSITKLAQAIEGSQS